MILAQLRGWLYSQAPFLKSKQDTLIPELYFSLLLSYFTFQNFPTPLTSFSLIYILPLVELSWWGDFPHVSGSLRITSLIRRDLPPIVNMTFLKLAVWRWLSLRRRIPPRHYFLFTASLGVPNLNVWPSPSWMFGQAHISSATWAEMGWEHLMNGPIAWS